MEISGVSSRKGDKMKVLIQKARESPLDELIELTWGQDDNAQPRPRRWKKESNQLEREEKNV